MKKNKILPILLATALLAGCLTGCGGKTAGQADAGSLDTDNSAQTKKTSQQVGGAAVQPLAAKSYDEVLSTLRNIQAEQQANADKNMAMMNAAPGVDETADAAADTDAGKDYSDTNTQVGGVEEGDVVKTDGSYLYVLRDCEVTILKADGPNTAEVGKVIVCENEWDGNSSETAQSMYVDGDVLAVITQMYRWGSMMNDAGTESGAYQPADSAEESNRTHVKLFDISDRSNPQQTADLAQDGYYLDSREAGGILYLVSNYDVYDIGGDSPEKYVPCAGSGDSLAAIPAGNIYLCPSAEATSYAVVSSVDVSGGSILSTQAVMGGAGTIYMSADNLYLASSCNQITASDPYTQKQYQVVDYTSTSETAIERFSLDGGMLTMEAAGAVPGYPLNQFIMDEYDGYLRLATIQDSFTYQVYTDPSYDFTNYKDGGSQSSSGIYILDGELKTVGTLGPYSGEDQLYAVRFDGVTGYVAACGDQTTLCAADLSDPAKPVLRPDLKLTDFSDYRHVFTDGRMIGLGAAVDTKTGEASSMKLAMFDVTDPVDVKEVTSVQVDDSGEEALYNHKAVLVNAEKSLIAFPGNGQYLVYSYAEGDGFVRKGAFDIEQYSNQTRCLCVGEYLYVCSPYCVSVANLDSLEKVQYLEFVSG